jgi:hypothetical protein
MLTACTDIKNVETTETAETAEAVINGNGSTDPSDYRYHVVITAKAKKGTNYQCTVDSAVALDATLNYDSLFMALKSFEKKCRSVEGYGYTVGVTILGLSVEGENISSTLGYYTTYSEGFGVIDSIPFNGASYINDKGNFKFIFDNRLYSVVHILIKSEINAAVRRYGDPLNKLELVQESRIFRDDVELMDVDGNKYYYDYKKLIIVEAPKVEPVSLSLDEI